ncbi:MAG: acyl-protein synthetase [Gracilibacteraceae bacterium]|jgi:hypothetical protein|nr:acyl-protein synthetase [Gracilibacteraceae bacterium]
MLNELFNTAPYALARAEKEKTLTALLTRLTAHHYEKCREYRAMLDGYGFSPRRPVDSYYDLPFLPVRLFKELTLSSVGADEVFKTLTSSGTTGQAVSKICLDRITAANQQKALVKIISSFLGSARLPLIIIDCPSVLKNRHSFSARGAGVLGFSIFGAERIYALDDDMNLRVDALADFLRRHAGERILLFGFTFLIWRHFYAALQESALSLDLTDGIMIHGGGWKKLSDQRVSPAVFKAGLQAVCGLERVHDYYGMAEQTGCVYVECEKGYLHASVFSDIIMRRPSDLKVCAFGEKGVAEVVSVLPHSYCGHALLTEDEGVIVGEDDCACGRKGKYFTLTGRIKAAELRGCGDTYAANFS